MGVMCCASKKGEKVVRIKFVGDCVSRVAGGRRKRIRKVVCKDCDKSGSEVL